MGAWKPREAVQPRENIMLNTDDHRSSPWTIGDKLLRLAILAVAGIGCLVLSRTDGRGAADRASPRREPGRRASPSKIRTEEPMAGYGR